MLEELFYRYNPWWENRFEIDAIERPFAMRSLKNAWSNKRAVFLTGLRRVGKTTILKLFIKFLINSKKISRQRIFYISLDDYLISKQTLLSLVEKFRSLWRIRYSEKIVLIFDEIAYFPDWEQQLKNLIDLQNVKIFASSSSASVLISKKSRLTGRNEMIELLPLDFAEYLIFKKIALSKKDSHLTNVYFEDFLKTGGIPEFVLHGDAEYLKSLVDDIIQKDIAVFYGVKDTAILKDFFLLLMERAGKQVSLNKMANILGISVDTAKRFFEMFSSSFLIHPVFRFGKINQRILSPRKIYAADLGIRTLFTGFRDKGSLFENYVYLKIKNKAPRYVFENGNEIDFFTEDKTLIEVKYQAAMIKNGQKKLFDLFPAKKKMIISGWKDVENFL